MKAWLLDLVLGPKCGLCGWRARGPRTLIRHLWLDHGDA